MNFSEEKWGKKEVFKAGRPSLHFAPGVKIYSTLHVQPFGPQFPQPYNGMPCLRGTKGLSQFQRSSSALLPQPLKSSSHPVTQGG